MRVPLLNFEVGPGVPLLNFEGDPRSRVPGSRGPGPTFTPCCNFFVVEILSEPSSLTIVTIKKYSKLAIMCSF